MIQFIWPSGRKIGRRDPDERLSGAGDGETFIPKGRHREFVGCDCVV